MSNLISSTHNTVLRRRQSGFGELADVDTYNHTSLALDARSDVTTWPQPMPRLISARYAAPNAAPPERLIWKGIDPLEFKRDRKSNVISFVVHAAIVTAVVGWGLSSHPRVIQTSNTEVTPMHFTLYAPPPPQVMQVAKVQGGGGGGGAHHLIEPTRGSMPKVARIQTLPPQILRVSNPKLAVEPTMQVNLPANNSMPTLGVAQSPQIALASQGSGSGSGFAAVWAAALGQAKAPGLVWEPAGVMVAG
jgi:periplasmic protein TonB